MTSTTVKRMGHEFQPMDGDDWESFSGAEEGTMICYVNDTLTLLLSPRGDIIAVEPDGTEITWRIVE